MMPLPIAPPRRQLNTFYLLSSPFPFRFPLPHYQITLPSSDNLCNTFMDIALAMSISFNAPPHDFERSENIMQAVVGAALSCSSELLP
jgi:hypothetical protein